MRRQPLFMWLEFAARLRRRCVEIADSFEVTLDDMAILSCLLDYGPMNQGVLARRVGIDRANLVEHLYRLGGRVSMEILERDGRCTEVSATDSGTGLRAQVFAQLDRLEREILGVLSAEEQELWRSLTARLLVAHCYAPGHVSPKQST